MAMSTALLFHPACFDHQMVAGHPEQPNRVRVIEEHLKMLGIYDFLDVVEAPRASRAQLERAHARTLVDTVFASSPSDGLVQIDPDTFMGPATLEAALRAAGAAVKATEMVLRQEARNAFCNVRPPGHHAERSTPMGFCFFNNIAIGAAHALEEFGLGRVAVLDFDVHHGNGTEDIFRADRRVMVCSSYQHPLYPYSGAPTIPGHIINTPLPAGAGGEELRDAVTYEWLPELERFSPEMIFVSAGFDGHLQDPLAQLRYRDQDYQWITEIILDVARRHSEGRVVSMLEGGYDLEALARSVALHVRALLEA